MFSTPHTGFTLVETLVAISLLLVAVVGPMTFLTRSSQSTEVANEQIPAVYLAQEGAELVQQRRDNEFLTWFSNPNYDAWSQFKLAFNGCDSYSSPCAVEIADGNAGTVSVTECSDTDNDCALYYDTSNERSRYTYSSTATTTPYRRLVWIEEVEAGREVRVVSRVEWRSGSLIEQQVAEVETALLNVYKTD